MSGIQMMVMNNVQPTLTFPVPILYLDATDYSGSGATWPADIGSDATLINAPAYTAAAPTYFTFNGTDEAATTANLKANFAASNSQTLEIWVNTASDDGVVISQHGTSTINAFYHLSVMEIVSGDLKVGLWQEPGNIGNVTVGSVTRNQWQQYVLTYDDATNTLTGYIDADVTANTTLENSPPLPGWFYSLCAVDGTNMGDGSYLAADVGLFRVWNSALSAAQVTELYNENVARFSNSVVTSNLVAYYDPSLVAGYPGTGTTLNDLSGNGLNGTMSNITWTDPYFVYNGTNSTVSIADNALLEPGTGDFTIEAWVNATTLAGFSRVILGKFDNGGASQDVSYALRSLATGVTRLEVGNGTSTVNSPTFTLSTGIWYQIVGVWTNVASNSIELYVNGVSQGSNSHAFAAVLNHGNPLYLGSYNGGEFPQWWDGNIGIVRYYNKALSVAEVQQNFDANRDIYGI